MNITSVSTPLAQTAADVLVVGLFADTPLAGPAVALDQATGGAVTRLLAAKEISGKKYETATLLAPAGVQAGLVVFVGLGSPASFDRGVAYRAAAAAAKAASGKDRKKVAFFLADNLEEGRAEAAVCGAIVGCQGQDLYRGKKSRFPFAEIAFHGVSAAALGSGQILGDATNLARRLVNEPPSVIYPESFAAEAERVARDCGLAIEIWDENKLAAERCGSLLAVAQGSARPARLVMLKHSGGPANQPALAIVGKGVTFDAGGLSIKPNDGMKTMKCDMAGAATTLAAMQAIARLKLPVNVVGYCGLVENMLGGAAYKLGDVLHARSGKTIEVLNTDAEGRLVLADVLNVCLERGAAKIVDLATLTGACVVALGTDVAGLMTNHQAWADEVRAAAETCGEPVWPLPMFPEFGEQIRSEVADIKNIGEGRWGGAITAAKFLEEFVDGRPWVHLDIAGPAFYESPKPWLDAGGSGMYVRTLVELVRSSGGGAARGVGG
jgi:leucyl aminopeptidase